MVFFTMVHNGIFYTKYNYKSYKYLSFYKWYNNYCKSWMNKYSVQQSPKVRQLQYVKFIIKVICGETHLCPCLVLNEIHDWCCHVKNIKTTTWPGIHKLVGIPFLRSNPREQNHKLWRGAQCSRYGGVGPMKIGVTKAFRYLQSI